MSDENQHATASTKRIGVLQSFPGRGPQTNPYLLQLTDSLGSDVEVMYFSWRTALLGSYDVLHLHWPERLARGSSTAKTFVRRLALMALIARISRRKTPVVRTMHNLATHEAGDRWERALLRAMDARTTAWIRLNPFTPTPSEVSTVTIRHGHYRDWYPQPSSSDVIPGRILFFGLIRPYKGVEDLIGAFAALDDPSASLRLAGKPKSAELAGSIAAASLGDHRVSSVLRHLADDELSQEIGASQLVVLPYRAVHNSGAAILALSLGRPVLMPSGETTEWLSEEMGPGWVRTFAGPLTPEILREALAAAAELAGHPDLSRLEWRGIGEAHVRAYRAAIRSTHAPRTDHASGTPVAARTQGVDDVPAGR
ncbi:glycosyltransferase [Naasia lichenicola]|uniref:GDP-mannose--glycolipid 4-beta-D-mannosyltransferase n=1 Tax=Naasia lichenicola TaxID=2565933 RepID=A0A4S4FLM3_9MICO|nr:glycosyltransferase [Naasia lichenicola]THG30802.1 hypothetical protein E6C64_09195 [Naasia lichenicola]